MTVDILSSIPAQEIELATIDIAQFGIVSDGLYFYQNKADKVDFIVKDKLVNGLHRLIAEHYPIMVGRPQVNAKGKVVMAVDPTDLAVPSFEEISVDTPAEDYFITKDNVKFFDIHKFYQKSGISKLPRATKHKKDSLAIFRTLRFKNSDYVGLMFSVSHAIFDGTAMIAFMTHWAQYVRDSTNAKLRKPPIGDRNVVNKYFEGVEPKELPFIKHFNQIIPGSPPVSFDSIAPMLLSSPDVEMVADQHLIHFTKAKLEQMRQDLDPSQTTNFVLLAMIIRAITKANTEVFYDEPEYVYPVVAYDCRFRSDIPAEYAGNLSSAVIAPLTGKMTLNSSYPELIKAIKEPCLKMESGHTKAILEGIQNDVGHFYQVSNALCNTPDTSYFCLSNVRYLPFQDIDFGNGKPEIVCFDHFFKEGLSRLCQNYQDGGVDLFMNYRNAHFALLKKNPDVVKYGDVVF